MAFETIFTDTISKLESIPDLKVVSNSKPSANFQRTKSNVNQRFKFIDIWNDQIDAEIQSSKYGEPIIMKGFTIKCPAIFIEFIPEDPNQIGGRVTQYLDAKLYLHIYSDELNTPSTKLNPNDGDLMDANFEIYKLRDEAKSAMMGFRPTNCSALMARYDGLDYKHGTITKYILGFSCPFIDFQGSILDNKSESYIVPTPINATLGISSKSIWTSKSIYTSLISVVWYLGSVSPVIEQGYYLCLTTNQSALFQPTEWQYLPIWEAGKTYAINNYIYYGYFCYKCNNANSDTTFNPSNWDLITHL